MKAHWIIEKKRDRKTLTRKEIAFFVQGYAGGKIPDYQASALAMAIYFTGMTLEEISFLTSEMAASGSYLDTSSLGGVTVDKHSTGGVGDKVSLPLAPVLSACGAFVPMISGRGLGITGGTLDKLEAIPGFRTSLSEEEFIEVVRSAGCAISGATAKLAPADRKLYALRDVTATVPSVPLIASSIMSKKIAENVDVLVLDIKFGDGAFMQEYDRAKRLAEVMVGIGTALGKKVTAILTDMNQPLGRAAGNAVEVLESIQLLEGAHIPGLSEVTEELCIQALLESGISGSPEAAKTRIAEVIKSGAARERFDKMVTLQGGNTDYSSLEEAPHQLPFTAESSGYVARVSAGAIGRICGELGAGRQTMEDSVDHAVGVVGLKKTGEAVSKGEPLCVVHVRNREQFEQVLPLLKEAFSVTREEVEAPILIREQVRADALSLSKDDLII